MFGKLLITNTEKNHFDKAVKQNYAWSDNEKVAAFSRSADVVIELFEQNLEHARHVENERLTYCACFTALIGGGLAVLNDLRGSPVGIVLSFILFLLSIFSFFLNERWSNAFERHMIYAKGCYYILHRSIELNMPDGKEPPDKSARPAQNPNNKLLDQSAFHINGCSNCDECGKRSNCNRCKEVFELEGNGEKLRLDTLPLYCFGINNPIKKARKKDCFWVDTRGTKQYFKGYYILICILVFLVVVYMCCSSWLTLKEELSVIFRFDLCLPKNLEVI